MSQVNAESFWAPSRHTLGVVRRLESSNPPLRFVAPKPHGAAWQGSEEVRKEGHAGGRPPRPAREQADGESDVLANRTPAPRAAVTASVGLWPGTRPRGRLSGAAFGAGSDQPFLQP